MTMQMGGTIHTLSLSKFNVMIFAEAHKISPNYHALKVIYNMYSCNSIHYKQKKMYEREQVTIK